MTGNVLQIGVSASLVNRQSEAEAIIKKALRLFAVISWCDFETIKINYMTDLKTEKSILLKFIDGVYSQQISREQIEQRIEMFAIIVADKQRECCALWIEDRNVMSCPLATDDFK